MKRYKIPKNILQLPFKTNIYVLLIASILLSISFVGLSIIEGIQNNIKKNITQNYSSHWNATRIANTDFKQLDTWWGNRFDAIDKLTENEYIRGVTTRSILEVLYEDQPIHLTVIENSDNKVFDDYMLSNDQILINQIHISTHLAQKLGIDVGQQISLYIPSLNNTISNLTVGYIFEPIDSFYGQYGAYIQRATINNIIGMRFQSYHVRFLASPIISLIEPSLDKNAVNRRKKYVDDFLSYQYHQLNSIRDIIHQSVCILYVLIGFIIFVLHHSKHNQVKLDSYAYRMGFIQPQEPIFRVFISCAGKLILITILATLITLGFVNLQLEFNSSLFTNIDPLYSQYNLPLTYKFSAQFPWLTSIPLGLALGLLSNGILLLCMKIPYTKDNIDYNFFKMFGVTLLGIICTFQYINVNFAREGRNSYWNQYFFGRNMLASENYHRYNSFQIAPPNFTLPVDSFNIFQEKQITYMASYETYGVISPGTTTNTRTKTAAPTKKYIPVKSLQGNLVQFSNILEPLLSNQIIMGKNLGNYFIDHHPASLSIPHKGSNITLSISRPPVIDIPVGDFNNSIFINHTNLMTLLDVEIDQITKLQLVGRKEHLTTLTNDDNYILSLDKNTSFWNKLSDISVFALFIKTLLLGVCSAVFVLAMMYNVQTRKELFTDYMWGLEHQPLLKHSIIYACCFAVGTSMAWFINLIYCLRPQRLPDFLQIPELVPRTINFSPSWTVVPLLLLGFALFFIIVYYIFNYILKQKQTTIHKDYLSQEH